MRGLVVVFALLLCLARHSSAINFDLPPGKEECFFEDVHQGTNINGAYVVTRGGSHLDIDVAIFNPDNTQVYNAKREGEDKFMLKADKDGTYKFCFSNSVRLDAVHPVLLSPGTKHVRLNLVAD